MKSGPSSNVSLPIVLAITGASGSAYALRLLEALLQTGHTVHLTISPSGREVMRTELGFQPDLLDFTLDQLGLAGSTPWWSRLASSEPRPVVAAPRQGQLRYFHYQDFMAPIASGSHRTQAMVVCPCSGSTLSAIVHATGGNLIHRAADVHLKERRPLILVPRETPLSVPQLENMAAAARAGATVLPAMPGWYHEVRELMDLVDFVVARVLDQLQVPHALIRRWGEPPGGES